MSHASISPRVAVSYAFFGCGIIFASWAARIPAYKDYFSLNDAELGAILFLLPLGSLSALPLAGWVINRYGSRSLTTISAIFYALSLCALSYVKSPAQLSVALFSFGFIGDFLNISMNTQGLSVQQLGQKPILSGLHAQWSFGAFAGALLGGWSFQYGLSTEQHFWIVTVITGLPFLFLWRYMVSDESRQQENRKIFSRPERALILLGLICFCNTMAEGAMADWSVLYYREVLAIPEKSSTVGYISFTVAMALGRLFGDRIIQSIGNRLTLMLNGLLIAVGLGLALAVPQPAFVIIGFALTGLGVSSVIPIAYMIAGQNRHMAPAASLALVSTIGFTGFLAGPPVIGFLSYEWGLRLALLLVVALGLLIAMAAAKGIKR